jgi:hypothetical protein
VRWRIGPLELWAARCEREWRLGHITGDDTLDTRVEVEAPAAASEPPKGATVLRFGYREPPETIRLTPVLADRPVVVSPESPLLVPPGQDLVLYLSTPLWVQVTIGSSPAALLDQPTHRPTDTWFGSSTMAGELCYGSRTAARLNIDNVPVRPYRAVTIAEIGNRAKTPLTVEKLRIPTPNMSVYATAEGQLWTETVSFERQEEGEMARVSHGKGPPDLAPSARVLGAPRTPWEHGLIVRTFGSLLR